MRSNKETTFLSRFLEDGQNIVDSLILLCTSDHAEEYKGEHAYYMLLKWMKRRPQRSLKKMCSNISKQNWIANTIC